MGSATVVGITRAPSVLEDGGVLKARCTDEHQALQHAERKVRTYGKALFALAGLLCLSVCGNLASSALTTLVFNHFKESRVPAEVPSDSKAAAPVGTGLTSQHGTGPKGMTVTPFEVPTYDKDTADDEWAPTGMKRCAVAPGGAEACWELADPAMTDVPDFFLQDYTGLTGTLKVGAAIKTIGTSAFANTKLTRLDLSDATSLVEIGYAAFSSNDLGGTLVIPAKVTTIRTSAFANTKLGGLDLSKATSLVEIGYAAFTATDLGGTLVIPAKVTTIGYYAFEGTKLTGLDLSDATSLVEIGCGAFSSNDLGGTLVIPAKVTTIGYYAFASTKLGGLDLSKATSLVEIGDGAFSDTDLGGTLVIPAKVTTIGASAFQGTKFTGIDLSRVDLYNATSLLGYP